MGRFARLDPVRLEHHDLRQQALRDSHALAWRTYLARPVVVAEGGDPGPDPHATAT